MQFIIKVPVLNIFCFLLVVYVCYFLNVCLENKFIRRTYYI